MNVIEAVNLALAMGASKGDEEVLGLLCQAAMDDLSRRLRPGVMMEDCSPAFEIACAWLALDHLEAASGTVNHVSAGDISFDLEGAGGGDLRQRAERLMAPYVVEKGFCFQGVRG